MDLSDDEVSLKVKRKRKVYSNNTNLKRESAKLKRCRGEEYVTKSGKTVSGKLFLNVVECCNQKCCNSFTEEHQEELFSSFYNQGKELQDSFLSKCMIKTAPKTETAQPKKPRNHTWTYSLNIGGLSVAVCKGFLIRLFQVTTKRIRVIQGKILKDEDFTERRGHHANRPHKLKPNVLDLMKSHLESIPHSQSRYSGNKTSLKYFDNPELNIKTLYTMFQEFYKSKTNENLKMGYPHYFKHLKSNFDFGVVKPKSDVCDYCTECKLKLSRNPNDPCKVPYQTHQRNFKRRLALKKEYIEKAKSDPSYLVCEFDYAQNYPVPKLNVNSQFYKRLLWLYAFNIHVFNDDESYFYCFMESQASKNSNSVASFLYDCLKKYVENLSQIKTVVLLSDSAGGQNRNSTMIKFCSWFSKVFDVEILQLFPVRGHSFTQCDRNFGLVRSRIKKREVIGTAKPWLEAMVHARQNPSPFQVIMDRNLIKKWDESLEPLFIDIQKSAKILNFTIMKYVMIKYKTDGSILCSNSFIPTYTPFKFLKNLDKTTLKELQPNSVPFPEVSQAKIKDVRSLMKYLPIEDQDWLEQMFDETS